MRCADCRGPITPLRTSRTRYRHVPGLPPCEVHPPRPLEDAPGEAEPFGEFCYEHGEEMADHDHDPPGDAGEQGSAEPGGRLSGLRTDAPQRPRPDGPVLRQ